MGRRRLKPLRSVVRFMVWRERIAPDCEAWCCYGEVVRNGRLYAGGTMLLADARYSNRGDAKEGVILKFVQAAKSGRMAGPAPTLTWHGIPFAGFLRDLRR
jgi:hypothetical protein